MWRWNSRRTADGPAAPGPFALIALASLSAALLTAPTRLRAAVPAALPAGPVETPAEWLLLGVRINGIDHARNVQAVRLPQGLAVPRESWVEWQLKLPNRTPLTIDGSTWQLLDDADGLQWRIDDASQTLLIDAPATTFSGGRYAVASDNAPAVLQHSLGGYLNYDTQLQATRMAGTDMRSGYAFLEAGGFYQGGNGGTTGLVRHDFTGTRVLRLDTGWNVDSPDDMTSLRVGDSISRSGTWGRSLRFGGVQWGTNFATRPGFLSFPLPTLRGEAALPSTLDLYINNTKRYSSQLPPGPFELSNMPIVTGQGQIRMVVRDVLGREQVVTQPYFVSPTLLRPGLHSRAVDVGFLRENYGLRSDDYGSAIVSAMDREGISDNFTREWRAEVMARQQTVGAAGVWALPEVGTLNASLALGRSRDDQGGMVTLGAEHQAARWSGSVQFKNAQRGFIQQGQQADSSPHQSVALALGSAIGRGSVGATYIKQTTWQGEDARIASVSYGRDLGLFGYLGVFALRDLHQPKGYTVTLSLTFALGEHTSASVNATRLRDNNGSSRANSLQLQRNLPTGPGYGYQITADRGSSDRYQALGTLQTETASFQGGIARAGQQDDARIGVSGGVAWVGSNLLMSRRIDGSFAVVEVSDYPNVQVLQDNHPVARTDARGRALVTGLRGYQRNRISVDPAELPFDAEVDALEVMLTPGARSGSQITFPVQRARAATFRLVLADGRAVPPGSSVQVQGRPRTFPVGYDGMGFASGLKARNTLVARWPGEECRAEATFAEADDEVPELGTLVCKAGTP